MRVRSVSLLFAALLAFAGAAPATAITNGTPDGTNLYPYVGAVATFDAEGNLRSVVSGSLISPTVVLTSGHVTAGKASARVAFAPDVSAVDWQTGGYAGTPYAYPGFLADYVYADIGLVVLDQPVPTSLVPRYAQLPPVGIVDRLEHMAALTYVGYGRYDQVQAPGVRPWDRWVRDWLRRYAPGALIRSTMNLTVVPGYFHALGSPPPDWGSMIMQVTTDPGDDRGGAAVGDSGGPALLAGTDIVLGMPSFGSGNDQNLTAPQHYTRVDLQPFLDWIKSFVGE